MSFVSLRINERLKISRGLSEYLEYHAELLSLSVKQITSHCYLLFIAFTEKGTLDLCWIIYLLLSARTVMWSIPVVLTETENENNSAIQNDVAK